MKKYSAGRDIDREREKKKNKTKATIKTITLKGKPQNSLKHDDVEI